MSAAETRQDLADYQRCLQLSAQNVHTLLYAEQVTSVHTFPVFIQLLDDDIVSLTALTLIVNPKCRDQSADSVAVSDDSVSVEATSLGDVTGSDTQIH